MGALQHGDGRMALVEMADIDLDAQAFQQPPTSDSGHDFLNQALLLAAAMVLVGNTTVDCSIERIDAVWQL